MATREAECHIHVFLPSRDPEGVHVTSCRAAGSGGISGSRSLPFRAEAHRGRESLICYRDQGKSDVPIERNPSTVSAY